MWHLDWRHGRASVVASAAMLLDLAFTLPSGRSVAPFSRAAWAGVSGEALGLTGHMRHLGAEFACLPFGVGGPVEAVDPAWSRLPLADANRPPHGEAANDQWTCLEAEPGRLRLALDYPGNHLVRRVERLITADPNAPALDFAFTIEARRAGRISAGLHPILSLDRPPESLRVSVPFRFGLTYPALVPGGGMATAVGRRFASLASVPASDGGTLDFRCLPLGPSIEDVVQLCGVEGPVEVELVPERVRLRVDWDRSILPSCQLWISDRALRDPPWSGRFRGLGIEPIASAFDFADSVSTADNPIAAAGIATSVALDPARPIVIRYRLAAEDTV